MLAHTEVHPLVVPTEDDDVLAQRQTVGHGLVQYVAVGRGEDDLVVVTLAFELLDASVDGLDLHDHSRLSAEGVVIDLAVLAQRPVAQVVYVELDQALVLRSLQDGAVQRRVECLGHDGEDVYSHEIKN